MTREQKEKFISGAEQLDPYFAREHMKILEIGRGTSRVEMPLTAAHCNRWGIPHGGVLFALADTACGVAMYSLRQEVCITVSSSMDFMAAARETEKIVARGRVTRAGGRTCFCQADVFADDGTHLARCHAVWQFTGKPAGE